MSKRLQLVMGSEGDLFDCELRRIDIPHEDGKKNVIFMLTIPNEQVSSVGIHNAFANVIQSWNDFGLKCHGIIVSDAFKLDVFEIEEVL